MTESNETIPKSGDPVDPVVMYTLYVLIALSIIGLGSNFYLWFFWTPKMKENDEEHNDQELQKELSPTKKLM